MKCCKCKKENSKIYKIKNRGYGSIYDGLTLIVNLCDDCKPKNFDLWINEKPKYEDYTEVYSYEYELYDFLKSLDIEEQEKIFNSNALGNSFILPKDKWIKWQLGEINIECILKEDKQ